MRDSEEGSVAELLFFNKKGKMGGSMIWAWREGDGVVWDTLYVLKDKAGQVSEYGLRTY